MNKKIIFFIFFIAICCISYFFVQIENTEIENIERQNTVIEDKNLLKKVNVEQKIYAQQNINELNNVNIPEGNLQKISFEYPLILKKYLVNEDQFIKKGDILAIIDENYFKKVVVTKEQELEKLNIEIKSLLNNIKFLSDNINFSKDRIKSSKELMDKQEAGLKYDHVTIEQFNLTKDNYIESQKKLNIEEIELNEYKNKLIDLQQLQEYNKKIYNEQQKILNQKVIYSPVDGFIKYHLNIINTNINANTELFLIEVTSDRTINLEINSKQIESLYLLFNKDLKDLKFTEKNNFLSFSLPYYLKSTRSYEDISIVISYFSNEKVLIIDPLFLYNDQYIWTVNEFNELKMLPIKIIGKHFNGGKEEWVTIPLQNIVDKEIKIVTDRLSNVKENQKVKI